ncbi:CitMHS family transporter [Prauserella rugosa]|uniref:CitMHS family citrate-Mg2+:H+ or citrate-Ca2+:H+ symporter n=1 Tax=Prauserella rugosa TaxID=43354 RepID=A0A660C777_9PSEU|nr:SLC13 family permease [Prauserella rugosa]KMS86508.1 citrate:H+ symporter [Streptomyces regensis]TWH19440.1 CitMHS family citrate-Mg2+:H+ or citrate-Ca2+:H+ symporter [Prauserella rugosa]
MLSIVGFGVIAAIATLLILGRIAPIVGLTVIPTVGAFLAGFNAEELGEFFESGLSSVLNVAVMLVFAILFFGIMNDVRLFNPLINLMVRVSRGNVVGVAMVTVIIGVVCHLDGSGATSYLIAIPALLPLYKRLGMSPYLLMLLLSTSMAILNMLPWGGPVGRAGAVTGHDPIELWHGLIPLQVVGIVLLLGMAALLGLRENRRIARAAVVQESEVVATSARATGGTDDTSGAQPSRRGASATGDTGGVGTGGVDTVVRGAADAGGDQDTPQNAVDGRPHLPWFNAVLVLSVLGVLVADVLPAGLVFMLGLSAALVVNYPKVSDQMERIRAHGGSALGTGGIILAAGCFLGVMEESGMLRSLASDMIGLLPEAVVPYLHLIVGVLGMPLELVLSTDAHYFALLPLVHDAATQLGAGSLTVVYAVLVGNIIGTYISPFNASVWLGVGLAGVDLGKHIRYSFLPMWAFSIVLLIIAVPLGVIVL